MNALRGAMNALWVATLGAITLFLFFVVIGARDPADVWWLTGAIALLAILATIHFIRVRHTLGEPGGNELARSVHAMRERRGF